MSISIDQMVVKDDTATLLLPPGMFKISIIKNDMIADIGTAFIHPAGGEPEVQLTLGANN